MKKFISLSILLILSRVADAQTTYLYTPDLKYEANPLVHFLKFNWTGLIISEIVLLAILIYAFWVYCFKTVRTEPFDNSTSWQQFISLFNFGNKKNLENFFINYPQIKTLPCTH